MRKCLQKIFAYSLSYYFFGYFRLFLFACLSCVDELSRGPSLCEKEFVLGVILVLIFRIWTEYGEILFISPYSVRMRENADQNNSEYGHFLRSAFCKN